MSNQSSRKTAIELLAPAGSFAAFKAAMEEGADAIYIGAPELNARALSRDFTYQEIASLVQAAHDKSIKLYIAMNSLVKEDEVEKVLKGLAMLEEIGPDALIIQDLGLFNLARTHFPKIALHASTLMLAHNAMAVQEFIDMGFKRVVLPRELTLAEIQDIYKKTNAELEVFVHGAMCFSYSGLCLFSSMFGGKSSLRGQCVQPCRRRYTWQKKKSFVKQGKLSEKDGGYLFSMHDLSGIELLPRLQAAGVKSFKIEGRLKSAEYVRKVVRAYRLVLDNLHDKKGFGKVLTKAQGYLDEAMGRKRTSGYFLDNHPREAITPTLSGNIGLPVGKVTKLTEKLFGKGGAQTILSLNLIRDIRVGDRLRLHDEKSGERTAFTLHTLLMGERKVHLAKGGQRVQIVYENKVRKARSGSFAGNVFKVDINTGRDEEQQARKSLLGKKAISIEVDNSKLEVLIAGRSLQVQRGNKLGGDSKAGKKPPIWLWIRSLRDRQFRLPVAPEKYIVPMTKENFELLQQAPPKLRRKDEDIIWSIPPVVHPDRLAWYKQSAKNLFQHGFTTFQLGHISQISMFAEIDNKGKRLELYGNYTWNIINSPALEMAETMNLRGVQFSMETDAENLNMAIQHFRMKEQNMRVGIYVFGHPSLFTARLDDHRYNYGKRFVSPRGEVFVLDRDDDLTRASAVDVFSLLDSRQELLQYGIDYLVVDFTAGNIKKNLVEFSALFRGHNKDIPVLAGNFRTGLL